MRSTLTLMIGLAAFTLLWRVVPHGWNMTPVLALALFAGARLQMPALRIILPLAVMLLSDLLLGFHDTMLYVYGSLLLVVLMGQGLGARASLPGHAGMSLAGSMIFFAITNFGVWMSGTLYPLTAEGLASSYVMALPFLWKTLAGDLFFVVMFFAVFRLAAQSEQVSLPAKIRISD
ncbi:MAG: DUF6580 family putative transport protein [Alcanivoracaceae bacterium]|jgi:hypothetical protein|nr:DUF6580 family putative transport protein [Alcanivoracaceae bacterium]